MSKHTVIMGLSLHKKHDEDIIKAIERLARSNARSKSFIMRELLRAAIEKEVKNVQNISV